MLPQTRRFRKNSLYGGAKVLLDYLERIGLQKILSRHLPISKRKDSLYPLPDVGVVMVTGYLLGKKRLPHFEDLEADPLLALKLAPKPSRNFTVARMRRMFWMIPGVLARHARQWILRLWRGFPRQQSFREMKQRLLQSAEQITNLNVSNSARVTYHPISPKTPTGVVQFEV